MDILSIVSTAVSVLSLAFAAFVGLRSARKDKVETLVTILDELEDQYAKLREQYQQLEAENEALRADNTLLRAQFEELRRENARLREALRCADININGECGTPPLGFGKL